MGKLRNRKVSELKDVGTGIATILTLSNNEEEEDTLALSNSNTFLLSYENVGTCWLFISNRLYGISKGKRTPHHADEAVKKFRPTKNWTGANKKSIDPKNKLNCDLFCRNSEVVS